MNMHRWSSIFPNLLLWLNFGICMQISSCTVFHSGFCALIYQYFDIETIFACLNLMVLVIRVTNSLEKENYESRYLCLQKLRPGQALSEVQTFSRLCVFSLSKFIFHFIGDNFSCPSQNLKIVFPPSKTFFSFYVNILLPKSKVANRGSTHILHAGNSLTIRTDDQEPCLTIDVAQRAVLKYCITTVIFEYIQNVVVFHW